MPGRTRLVILGAAAGAAGAAITVRTRARAAGMTPRDYLRGESRAFVTHRFDPLVTRLGLVGGRVSRWAMLEHVGRASGSIYRTPVYPLLSATAVHIPLPYGGDAHWVQNVLAAGHCRMQLHERVYELDEPRILGGDEVDALPPAGRAFARRIRATYLALHRLSDIEGTFAPHADATGTPEADWMIAPLEPAPEPLPEAASPADPATIGSAT
jgi:deazaflavin-dependent oxidoreductase (nitroreductase family)